MSSIDLSSKKKSNHRSKKRDNIARHEDAMSCKSTLSSSTVHREFVSMHAPLELNGSTRNEQLKEVDSEEHRYSKPLRRKEQRHESGAYTSGLKEQGKADLWRWITSSNDSKMQEFCIVPRDWALISVFTAVTLGIRLWRISWPDEAA